MKPSLPAFAGKAIRNEINRLRPVDLAALAHRSVEEFGLLSAEVAHQVRVSRSVIAKWLQNRGAREFQ